MTKSPEMASAEDSPASTSPRPRWLVTGASGRVGRMLWRQWEMEPPAATMLRQVRKVVPEAPTDIQWSPLIQPIPADAGRVDCLIAYAGVTPGHGAELAQNAALADATLAAAHAAGIPRVLLTSSSAIYGASRNGLAFTEADQPRPDNIYGRSKLSMEAVCAPWRARGLEVCCLRIGNVAGADQLLLNGLKASGKPLSLDRFHDGGGPIRSYVGAATLARITATLAAHPDALPPSLNISAPLPVAMADLAQAASFDFAWKEAPASAHQRITLDVSQLEGLYSFAAIDSSPQEMIAQWLRLRDG